MEIRDPELRQIIRDLNKDWSDKFSGVIGNYENDRWVELKNGERKRVLVKDAVAVMHDDIKSIKDTIEPIKDIQTVHTIFKKWKAYYGGAFIVVATIFKLWFFT